MATRVSFQIKTNGTVNSYYVWVERKNVRLRNKKGYLMLQPRRTYEVVFMAKGRKNATAELIVKQGDTKLGSKKRTIKERRVVSDSVSITVRGAA